MDTGDILMQTTEKISDNEIRYLGLEAIKKELGIAGFVRFMQLFDNGSGDYTKERSPQQQGITVVEIVEEIGK